MCASNGVQQDITGWIVSVFSQDAPPVLANPGNKSVSVNQPWLLPDRPPMSTITYLLIRCKTIRSAAQTATTAVLIGP
jgi:hypothetical protein